MDNTKYYHCELIDWNEPIIEFNKWEISDYYDPYDSNDANDVNYWGNDHSLKSSPRRILHNPYANNIVPKIDGVVLSGVSIKQT